MHLMQQTRTIKTNMDANFETIATKKNFHVTRPVQKILKQLLV